LVSKRVMVFVLALVAISVIFSVPRQALADYRILRITSGNLTKLKSYPSSAFGKTRKLKYTHGVKLTAYGRREYNRKGYYRIGNGQCVTAVLSLANKNRVYTSRWVKGGLVTAGRVNPGVVIATFNSAGKYYGHAAIFKRYIRNRAGAISAIEVWDQNWSSSGDGMFRKHILKRSGRKLSDADRYRWVKYRAATGIRKMHKKIEPIGQ